MSSLRVAVLLGGRSDEAEVSRASGTRVVEALQRLGHDVHPVEGNDDAFSTLRHLAPDVVFNALHGTWGEDGRMQAMLEWLGLPYTGSDVPACALAFDKHITKQLLRAQGLPTPRSLTVTLRADLAFPHDVPTPFVIKPRREGSSNGVAIIRSEADWSNALRDALRSSAREYLVEEFIAGREITVGILGETVLPPVEILTAAGHEFYTYASKYQVGGSRHIVPAPIDDIVRERIQSLALATHRALGLRDYSRTDIMLTASGQPMVLEINALPGLTELSLLPDAAAAVGIGYDELIERILSFSLARREHMSSR